MSNQLLIVPSSASHTGASADFLREVLHGLNRPNKRLPCKYFYDQTGGQLFDRICELDEYYVTRCELAILRSHASALADRIGSGAALIEYGSGASLKTRLLLEHLREPTAYLPVDINGEQLGRTARHLGPFYPHLQVHPIEADFTRPFALPILHRPAIRRVVYFSGSTIGNFEPPAARELLRSIARLCGRGGGLLIGVDLKKAPHVLHDAYNDRLGVTAAFNLNLLARINRELQGDFVPDRFFHYAFYNPVAGRIEMHLVSRSAQIVRVGGTAFDFAEGESVCTEYSYKYSLDDFERLADGSGLRVRQVWLDEDGLFSVQYLSIEA